MYLFLLVIVLLVAFIIWLSRSEQMGKLAIGERLKRMENTGTYRDGAFQNIELTPALKEGVSQFTVFKSFLVGKDKRNVPSKPLPVDVTDLKSLDRQQNILVWFGHSSYYLQMDGKRILVDPVFNDRASPIPGSIKAFPSTHRYRVADLPDDIDVVLITHDHWDHLDHPTFRQLKGRIGAIVTSLGVGAHLERWGYDSSMIHELYWHEDIQIGTLKITATPARHFSGRWLKRNTSLWSSFVLNSDSMRIFVGGDSGYGQHFRKIGEQYGPFDLAVLENGQYNEYWRYIHLMPEEVVQAAGDLNAEVFLPVHHSRFPLSNHAWDEPLIRVSAEAKKIGVPIWTPRLGQLIRLDQPNTFEHWWETVDH